MNNNWTFIYYIVNVFLKFLGFFENYLRENSTNIVLNFQAFKPIGLFQKKMSTIKNTFHIFNIWPKIQVSIVIHF